MQLILNQITTYFLACLILISTTGFSITSGWCDCIDEEYVMLFAKIACCDHEEEFAATPAACATADINCCDTESSEYAYADIDFQVNTDVEWSFEIVKWSFADIKQVLFYSPPTDLWYQSAIQLPPIKAPPSRFGIDLLVYIQTFLC